MEVGIADAAASREEIAHGSRTTRLNLSLKKMSGFWSKLEVAAVFCFILVVWGLLSLPIIFYHLPVEEVRLKPPLWFGVVSENQIQRKN